MTEAKVLGTIHDQELRVLKGGEFDLLMHAEFNNID